MSNSTPTAARKQDAALSIVESKDLRSLEQVIERVQKSFLEAGKALLAIKAQKLYRQDYKTFAEYCTDRWGFQKNHANRLIGAAKVIENLTPIGVIPETESQARPLTFLPADQQANAWADVVDECAERGEPITAAAVVEVVERYKAQDEPYVEQVEELPYELTRCTTCNAVLIDETSTVVCEFASGDIFEDHCRKCFEQGKVKDTPAHCNRDWYGSRYPIGTYMGDEEPVEVVVPKGKKPKPTNTPKEYPVSERLVKWIESLGAIETVIKQDYSGMENMLASKGWKKTDTGYFIDLLGRLAEAFTRLHKEAKGKAKTPGRPSGAAIKCVSMLNRGIGATLFDFWQDIKGQEKDGDVKVSMDIAADHPLGQAIGTFQTTIGEVTNWLRANFHTCSDCGEEVAADGAECPKCGPAEEWGDDDEQPAGGAEGTV